MKGNQSKRNDQGFDTEYTGGYPRNSGARNAVISGSPEDMNLMPAAEDPDGEGPTYDGSSEELHNDTEE
jgi:hypothetical protein